MKIKTFYAKSMPEALREIKATMGSEALLLSTKEVHRRSGVWGRSSGFEVVAACDQFEDSDVFSPSGALRNEEDTAHSNEVYSAKMPTGGIAADAFSPASINRNYPVTSAVMNSKPRNTRASSVEEAAEMPSGKGFSFRERVPDALYQDLIRCGMESSLARELILNARDGFADGQRCDRPVLLRAIERAALALIAAPSTQDGMPEKKVVAFIGPSGVGKTTSIAKLAARLALQNKKRVLLATLDGYRIGAIEQLRSYASLIGIPFRFADQVSELNSVIEENRQRDYILIDTAGRGPGDMDAMQNLAAFLKQSDTVERHLVLSATTKPSDMRQIVNRFEVCSPDHLLFTKLDETSTPGPIFNELVRTQKRFSYYTDGQRVPDDLHAVSGNRIIDIVLNRNENT
jgi:flagellar biosynthesis protein FlhF